MLSLVKLHAHPQTDSAPEVSVEVAIAREAGQLILRYEIRGKMAELLVPSPVASQRRDELWRHTCAELFVAAGDQPGYYEFNFSPSTEWAAYRFDDYRQGMRFLKCAPPVIDVLQDTECLLLHVRCALPVSSSDQSVKAGLTMVVEDSQGKLSYWALHHPVDKPDFHHRESFVLEL